MTTEIKLNTPCVITSKAGKLDGKIRDTLSDGRFLFDPMNIPSPLVLYLRDWNVEYPTPPLPTEPGTVIESGGVRFMLDDEGLWWSSKRIGMYEIRACRDPHMQDHIQSHNGFKILLEGIKEGEK